MIDTKTKEYFITRLSKHNLPDVAKLHTAVYGTSPAADYFPKKYDTAYTGVENVGYIAYSKDNLPVAYYGVVPCFIQYEDKIMLAAQSADTMTHPQYRYKGMFVELSNMTFDLCRELGIHLIFGFPNQNSYHGAVNKLGWKMTGAMSCFVIPVKTIPIQSICMKMDVLKNLYRAYCRLVLVGSLLKDKGIANSVLKEGYAGVYRDDDYLVYKTYSSTKVIKTGDVKIWFRDNFKLMIGDVEGINDENFKQVIRKLKRIAQKLGLRQVQFHCSPGTKLYCLFSAQFISVPSYPMLFQDFGSDISPEKIRFTFADIDIF